MTFKQLELYRRAYIHDHDTGHILFSACLTFARQIVGHDTSDAEEIAQAATWKAWEKFATLDPTTPFGPWFTRVIRSKIIDAHRKRTTRSRYEDQDFAQSSAAFSQEQKDRMREAAGDDQPLIDLLLLGHSIHEAADALGLDAATVKQRLLKLQKEQQANG